MQHLFKSEDISGFSSKIEVNKSFFNKIKFSNGKADLVGVVIFSEILSCFQNSHNVSKIQNENFLLDKSYADLSKEFGLTKRQVSDAVLRLEALGFIKRAILTIYKNKKAYPNSVFIELTAKSHEFLNINSNHESKEGRGVASINHQRPNFFCPALTLKRDIPLKRGPYMFINNNTNSIKIDKQTNRCVSIFNKKDYIDSSLTSKPFRKSSLIEELKSIPSEWESWAQKEFSWDQKTLQTELKRFFDYHKRTKSQFPDWFEAWKGWCKMSFNAKKSVTSCEKPENDYKFHSDKGYIINNNPEKTVNSQANTDLVHQEIREKLTFFGLSPARAKFAVETMDPAQILKAIAYVKIKMEAGLDIKNKAGYLWKALQDDYAKAHEEINGDILEIQKTPMMLRQEEESIVRAIEEGQGSELSKKVHKAFFKTFGIQSYKTWLKDIRFSQDAEKSITLKCPTNFYRDWLNTHLRSGVENALRGLFSEGIQVKFVA